MDHRTMQFRPLLTLVACLAVASCSPRVQSAPLPPPPPVVDLSKDINAMTQGELWQAVFALNGFWDPGVPYRRDCAQGGSGTCLGRIDAVRDTVPGPSDVSTNGTIVARLWNLGAVQGGGDRGAEQKYGIIRVTGVDTAYVIIAKPDGAGGWTWSVREAVRGGSSMPPRETVPGGAWITCDTSWPNHPSGKSAFYWCPAALTQNGAGAPEYPTLRLYNPRDPGWLDCDSGCCTAGY
jgi:hypothetical protein